MAARAATISRLVPGVGTPMELETERIERKRREKKLLRVFLRSFWFDGFWVLSLGEEGHLHRSAVDLALAHDRERSFIDFLGQFREILLELE
jgi:hypothetical protein